MKRNPPVIQGQPVAEDATLWRYMDIFRLLDILQTQQLHMTRADHMEDAWEGSGGSFPYMEGAERLNDESLNELHRPDLMFSGQQAMVYMNCWYLGDHESHAMWKLYGEGGIGVALKTSAGQLHHCLRSKDGDERIVAAKVTYGDSLSTSQPLDADVMFPFRFKRQSYAHEQEYRLLQVATPSVADGEYIPHISPDNPRQPQFLRVTVDLSELISDIYLSPDTPNWVATVVAKMIHEYAPWVDVVVSNLGQRPRY